MEKIREAFKEYFEGYDIELPEKIEKKGKISKGRWSITYVLTTDEEGKPALDFIADHPMSSMSHMRIRENGETVALESMRENYSYDAKIEGDEERARKEWQEHNDRVADILHEKGLI